MAVLQTFEKRIEAFSRVRRGIVNSALRYRLAVLAGLCGTASLIVLSGWLPNAFLNMFLFAAVGAYAAGLVVKYFIRRQRFRSFLDEAFRMEELEGTLNSRLISGYDFARLENPTNLMQVVIEQAENDFQNDFESKVDRRQRSLFRKRCAQVLVLFLAVGLTPWFGFGKAIDNFNNSLFAVREFLFPIVYEISPTPGQRHVRRVGTDENVLIRFERRGFKQVTLIETVGEDIIARDLEVDDDGVAKFNVRGQTESEYTFHFEFGQRKSDEIALVFANLPVLENMQTEIALPAYTRILPRSLEGIQQRLFGLPGTRITMGFTFSKEISNATFTWDTGEEPLPLDVAGRFASVTISHNQTRRATMQIEDIHGFNLEYPFHIYFELQADEPPQVFLPRDLKESLGVTAEGLRLFGFGVRLQDDYGVSRSVLHWQKSTISNPTRVTARGEIERIISPPRRQAIESFQQIFENVAAEPGDMFTYWVEAFDNRSPQAQRSRSESKSLWIYQQDLDSLNIARAHFGRDQVTRSRIGRSRRATTVAEPAGMVTREQVWNEWEADIDLTTRAPVVPGGYEQVVRDYLRLISTAADQAEAPEDVQDGGPGVEPEQR